VKEQIILGGVSAVVCLLMVFEIRRKKNWSLPNGQNKGIENEE
jgi:hypothetical protein